MCSKHAELRERAAAALSDHDFVEVRKDELIALLDAHDRLANLARVALDNAYEIRGVMTNEDRDACNELHLVLKALGIPKRPPTVIVP